MSKQKICSTSDLIPNSGVCALLNDSNDDSADNSQEQIAIFYLPDTPEKVFAINNWDPIGQANILSRGIICSIGDELTVASPLYKQHFSLSSGKCLEEDASVKTYSVSIEGDTVYLN